jgi:uncharacterized protein YqgC (DUF456 family)
MSSPYSFVLAFLVAVKVAVNPAIPSVALRVMSGQKLVQAGWKNQKA